jgi:hypothetical protein
MESVLYRGSKITARSRLLSVAVPRDTWQHYPPSSERVLTHLASETLYLELACPGTCTAAPNCCLVCILGVCPSA